MSLREQTRWSVGDCHYSANTRVHDIQRYSLCMFILSRVHVPASMRDNRFHSMWNSFIRSSTLPARWPTRRNRNGDTVAVYAPIDSRFGGDVKQQSWAAELWRPQPPACPQPPAFPQPPAHLQPMPRIRLHIKYDIWKWGSISWRLRFCCQNWEITSCTQIRNYKTSHLTF